MTNITPDLILHVDDTHATIIWNLKDLDGSDVDLTGYASVSVISKYGDSHKDTKVATVNTLDPAQIQWQFNAGMLKEGLNEIRAHVVWGAGTKSYTITDYVVRGIR